jgi:hypothetical protein
MFTNNTPHICFSTEPRKTRNNLKPDGLPRTIMNIPFAFVMGLIDCAGTDYNVPDFQFDEIACAKLAVDSEVEKRKIPDTVSQL